MLESAKSREELFKMSRQGQEIMNEIEQSTKPIVVAIAGSCLGGGFEVWFSKQYAFTFVLLTYSVSFSLSLSYCCQW